MKNSGKKKIIIIGPAYPYRGGNPTFVSYVYDILISRFDVKIFNYKLLYPSLLFPGTTQFDKSHTIIKKAPSERLINSINPFNWLAVARRINKEKADLIVFDWWHPFFAPCHFVISWLIKKYYKNKILFITENFISHEGRFIEGILTRFGLMNASAFLALSNTVEFELKPTAKNRKIYRSELPIFEYQADAQDNNIVQYKEQMGIAPNEKVLLFFGYVRKYKGLDLLIEAFPKIMQHIPESRLLIVGEFYDDFQFYSDLIDRLKIRDKVTIINQFIPNEEVVKYYSVADLVILPYKSATQSAVLTVAYGFNKPVLVTDVGGLSEFVEDKKTGIVTLPNSPDAIASGVKEFFKLRNSVNFELNIKMAVNSNKFQELPDLIEEIIN